MDQVNQKALEDLAAYKKKGCHMLVPCMDHIDDVANTFRLIVTPDLLRPHPKDKDVYPHDSSQYDSKANDWKKDFKTGAELVRLHGQGLEKLAQNANIIWSQPTIEIDRNNRGRQVCYITGALRMPDGFSFYRVPDLYGMDLDIEREKLIAQYGLSKEKQWLIDRDYLQKKVNQTKLCISGAKNRVIRKILGLDSTYTVAALAIEFISVRVIPWMDMNDEYTRRLVINSNVAQMAIANIFGGSPPEQGNRAIEYVGDVDPAKCTGDENVIDIPYEKNNGNGGDLPPDNAPTPIESQVADFNLLNITDRCKTLTNLAGRKKYDLAGFLDKAKKDLGSLMPETLERLFRNLVALPDPLAATGTEDEIPFL